MLNPKPWPRFAMFPEVRTLSLVSPAEEDAHWLRVRVLTWRYWAQPVLNL